MPAATPLYLSIMPAAIPPLSLHYAFLGSLIGHNGDESPRRDPESQHVFPD